MVDLAPVLLSKCMCIKGMYGVHEVVHRFDIEQSFLPGYVFVLCVAPPTKAS